MPNRTAPKLISGNANRSLAQSVAKRLSMHQGARINLVAARVEWFNDQEVFGEM